MTSCTASLGSPPTASSLRQQCQHGIKILQQGDAQGALAVFNSVLETAERHKVSMPDLHVCLCNRSAVLLQLGRPKEATRDALAALRTIEASAAGVPLRRCDGYPQSMRRLGDALAAQGLRGLAQDAYEEGLKAQPDHLGLRLGLQATLMCSTQHLSPPRSCPDPEPSPALPDPTPSSTATCEVAVVLQPAGPLASSKNSHTKGLMQLVAKQCPELPILKQLTPKQAEVNVVARDTLNYLTIQSDIAVPRQLLSGYLQDPVRMSALEAAVTAAVREITEVQGLECRVLVVGSGLGVVPLLALKAGAAHVTVVDRWLYVALACKELLEVHGCMSDQYHVIHADVTTLQLGKDIPVCCNLVIVDALVDSGVLTSGLSACVRHTVSHLATPDALVIPERIKVQCQAVEVLTPNAGDVTLSAVDALRHHTFPDLDPGPLPSGAARPLTDSVVCWDWHTKHLPQEPEARVLSHTAKSEGCVTSVAVWCDITLFRGIKVTCASPATINYQPPANPGVQPAVATSLHPVLHTLPTWQHVAAGDTVCLVVAHNTARLAVTWACPGTATQVTTLVTPGHGIPHAVYDVSVPKRHVINPHDSPRMRAYQEAIKQAVARATVDGRTGLHVLDLSAGCGTLGVTAALCEGVTSVTCMEAHPTVAATCRRTAALNQAASKVCVVQGDVGQVQLGVHVPKSGTDLVLLDLCDETLFGFGMVELLQAAVRRGLVAPDAEVLPARAVQWCVGVELLSQHPAGAHRNVQHRSTCSTSGPAAELSESLQEQSAAHPEQSSSDSLLGQMHLAPLNKCWYDDTPRPMALDTLPYRVVTPAFPLYEVDLRELVQGDDGTSVRIAAEEASSMASHINAASTESGQDHSAEYFVRTGNGGGLMLQAAATADGVLNAVLMWQDVHLGNSTVLTNAPAGLHASTDPATQSALLQPILQSTEHVMVAKKGSPVQLVCQRAGPRITVDVRPVRGTRAPRPPWKEEWGGGSSIENPHVQRVKYCELLESDLMQRLPSGRGPSVECDIRAMAAHCGSLQLHPPAVSQSLRHLALLERLYRPGGDPSGTCSALSGAKATDQWEVAVLAAQQQQEHNTGGRVDRARHSSQRVTFPPEVTPLVDWKRVQGCGTWWSV